MDLVLHARGLSREGLAGEETEVHDGEVKIMRREINGCPFKECMHNYLATEDTGREYTD